MYLADTRSSKFALEGFTEGLSKEMHPDWNIRFLIVEPGGVRTNFAKNIESLPRHPAYQDPACAFTQLEKYMNTPGVSDLWADPDVVARIMYDVIASRNKRSLPMRLALGSDCYSILEAEAKKSLQEIQDWQSVSEMASSAEQAEALKFLHSKQ